MLLNTVLLYVLLVLFSASPVSPQTRDTAGKEKDLDIYSFHIKSTVSSRYAMTVITSRVANRANESREVLFRVELPKNAFISKFSMTIDGQVYHGVVKKKEEAQTQYDQAVSRGQSAGLVSSVGRTLEEFQTSVTVAALSKVTFELTYEELLKRKLGQYQLLIKARPTQVVKDFKIEVRVYEQQGIQFLKTEGSLATGDRASALSKNVTEKEAVVQFTPSRELQQCAECGEAGLNGDLLITYDVNRPQSKGEIQVYNGYFVHYFAPTGLPRIPKNVVFIIDQSGSMHGQKITQTREALLKILGDIPAEDHFGLISFDDRLIHWKDHLVPANEENLSAARKFVRSIEDRGATDINGALLEGVRMLNRFKESHPQKGTASILILLTDGDPTAGVTDIRQIQRNIKEAIGRRYTLYCLGFGYDVNYDFLEKMALENEGLARRIYTDSDAALQLQGFYEEVATPLLLDIQVTYKGVSNLTQTRFGQYYNGSEIVVCGMVTDNNLEAFTAEVNAVTKDDEVVYHTVPEEIGMSELMKMYIFEMYMQRLWAYLTVQQLMEKMVLLTGEDQAHVKEQALNLALKYSFVTPLTSMVVTKPTGEDQVAHKPKEGKKTDFDSPAAGAAGSSGAFGAGGGGYGVLGLPGPPGQPGLGGVGYGYMAIPGPPHFGSPPRLMPVPPPLGGRYSVQMGQTQDSDVSLLMESDGDYDMDKMAKLVPSLPRPTFSSPAQRLLLPVRGSSPTPGPSPLPLCFDLGSTDPVRLLDDSSTGVVITAVPQLVGFRSITIQRERDWSILIQTNTITMRTGSFSWTDFPSTMQGSGVLIQRQGRELQVTLGGLTVNILLHHQQGLDFLWPDIKNLPSSHNASGLMGRLQVDYTLRQTGGRSAELNILGHSVPASRVSAPDYRDSSKPTVDCWLFPHKSVLQ